MKAGSEIIEATLAQEADPIHGVCGSYGGHETAQERDVRRPRGGGGFRGAAGKGVDGVGCLLVDLRAFGIQTDQWMSAAQDADEMVQNSKTRGVMLHDGMDRRREREPRLQYGMY